MEETLKYRITADLFFETEADALTVLNVIEQVKDGTWKPTGKEKVETNFHARAHQCYHDEDPPQQCKNYTNVNFSSPPKVHTEIK